MPPVTERVGEIIDRIVGHKIIPNMHRKIHYTSESFFPSAKSNIKILAWELPPEFYNNKEVVRALEEAAERGVEIEILHGQKMDIPNELSRLQQEGKIGLLELKKVGHVGFMTVDGKHTLVEETDLPQYAVVRRNTIFLTGNFEREFERLKRQALTA